MTYLLDTNILVYAVDNREPEKQQEARRLIQLLGGTGEAVLSTQTLAEFANVTLRRLEPPLPPDEAYHLVEQYERAFRVLPLTPAVVLEAVRGVRDHQLSYFDAQIWAAARLNQIPYVLTEDFNTDATLDGVTFLDPFDSGLDISRL